MPEPKIYSVAELVNRAHRLVEQSFNGVHVEGEVTNLRLVSSGHAYFTLTDGGALLPCAMWRSAVARLRFRLQDGQRLRVFGRPGIYAAQGKFQLYAERAEPAGQGALLLQLERLKAQLASEGLFAPSRKRPIPRWPRCIGVVTSPTGAAIHDILKVARRRCPVRVLLSPAQVQGDAAPQSLVHALHRLQSIPEVDVIILGRGGGASEDLWAFNDEALARAVAASRIPVVSAVGHEVDTTLVDFVADLRAATPSHAAELVVPDREALLQRLRQLERRLGLATRRRLLDERARLERGQTRLYTAARRLVLTPRRRLAALLARLGAQHPRQRLARDRRRLADLLARLGAEHPRTRLANVRRRLLAAEANLRRRAPQLSQPARIRLARAAGALHALSPLAVLARGYAIVTAADSGRTISDAAQVTPGDELVLRLHRGTLRAGVLTQDPGE